MTFGIILSYLSLLLFLGLFAGRLFKRTSGDFFLASRGIGPFMLLMSIFGTTMTAFALIGSTGKTFDRGIGVYGLMASWSGIVHASIFFLVGAKVWALGKKHGYVTQLSYFRDRYKSDTLVLCLFPLLVLFVMLYILMGVIGSGRFIQNITPETFAMKDHVTVVEAPKPADLAIPETWKERLSYDDAKSAFVVKGSLHPKRFGLFRKFSKEPGWTHPKTGTAREIVDAAPRGAVTIPYGMAIICVVVLFYVFFGGMRATAWANTMQTLVFMVMGIIAFCVITNALGGPVEASKNLLESNSREHSRMQREGLIHHLQFLTYVFIPLSVGMFPHLFQHWLTARKASNFKLTVIAHPICILITWIPCVLLGMWATGVLPESTAPNAVLGMMVARYSGEVLAGLIAAGVLAAIMSSMDSQFLCLSSLFTNDIVARYSKKQIDDRTRILYGRIFVIAVVLAAYLIGLTEPGSVFDMGVWCFTGFATLSPLLFASLYWKRTTKQGAIASVIVSAALWLGFLPNVFEASKSGGEFLLWGMMPVAFMVFCSTAALVIVSLATPEPSEEDVGKFFAK